MSTKNDIECDDISMSSLLTLEDTIENNMIDKKQKKGAIKTIHLL